jgi:hypothetical protein
MRLRYEKDGDDYLIIETTFGRNGKTKLKTVRYSEDLTWKSVDDDPRRPTTMVDVEWFLKHYKPKFEKKGQWTPVWFSVYDCQTGGHLHSGRNSATPLEAAVGALEWLETGYEFVDVSGLLTMARERELLTKLDAFECEVTHTMEEI